MSSNNYYFMAIYFFLGIVLLGLFGYMYDSITKSIPSEDERTDIFAVNAKLSTLIFAPFSYIAFNLKNKRYMALIPFLSFIFVIIAAITTGIFMIK